LLARITSDELDAAIAVREPGPALPELAWTPLYSEPMVLLTARSEAEGPARTLLQRQPFIRFDRSQHTGKLVERALRKLRASPQEILELNAIESMVDLVRSGLGVTLLPLLRDARWATDPRLRVIELPGAELRHIGLVHKRGAPGAAAVGALVREFQAQLKN
jgi:DNA-binding transcriptional LysR family regulator